MLNYCNIVLKWNSDLHVVHVNHTPFSALKRMNIIYILNKCILCDKQTIHKTHVVISSMAFYQQLCDDGVK